MFENSYAARTAIKDVEISEMSLTEIKPMLCAKSHGDAYVCIDCPATCKYGERAIELVDSQTKKTLTRKQCYDYSNKVVAMRTYFEAATSENPAKFLVEKYGYENEKKAKTKLYQWKHSYGSNMGMIENKIKELEAEIKASRDESNKQADETVTETEPIQEEEIKKPTKRQEEKISQDYLVRKRTELENDILKAEDEIKKMEREIELYKARIEEDSMQIQAIRQVLEIFKKKDRDLV